MDIWSTMGESVRAMYKRLYLIPPVEYTYFPCYIGRVGIYKSTADIELT